MRAIHPMQEAPKKGFLEELQSLDEPTKKKVLIIATAIIMVVVIYFWLMYFNSFVVDTTITNTVATGTPAVAAPAAPAGPGAWQNIEGWFASIGHAISGAFQAPRQYIVQPQ